MWLLIRDNFQLTQGIRRPKKKKKKVLEDLDLHTLILLKIGYDLDRQSIITYNSHVHT
jgi:hypothetical protein